MLQRTVSYLLLLLLLVGTFSTGGCAHSCAHPPGDLPLDYRQAMREFVEGISSYAKALDPSFLVIPQNGHELLTEDGTPSGAPVKSYIASIDGIGREDLFYGYAGDNEPTPAGITQQWLPFMDLAETRGISVLVTDYCADRAFVDDSYERSAERGYISFAADRRELDDIPAYPAVPTGENSDDIALLADARNFLYLINPVGFPNKQAFLNAIRGTNYDIVIIDLFDDDGVALSREDVNSIRVKRSGACAS